MSLDTLLLSETTRKAVENALNSDMHAFLLTGEPGAGKQTLAQHMAAYALNTEPADASPAVYKTEPVGTSIGINQIRELQQFLQLKTVGSARIRRVVLLQDADALTTEAQNAFLKVLEEPPTDTIIILTSSKPAKLASTIHSRVQTIRVQQPDAASVVDYFRTAGFAEPDIARNYALTNGQVGLMTALLSGDDGGLAAHVDQAKQLYTVSAFERLAMIDMLAKNKEELPLLLFACKRVCSSALENAIVRKSTQTAAWHNRLKRVVQAEEQLSRSPNTKLLLTDLLLNI